MRTNELTLLILLWASIMPMIYSPLLFIDRLPEVARPWVMISLLTFVIPQFINAVARDGGYYKRLSIDYDSMLYACVFTFALFTTFIQNPVLKKRIENFGKDIKSTSTTLALLVSILILSLIAVYRMRPSVYTHYIKLIR